MLRWWLVFFVSIRRRETISALVTGFQTWSLPSLQVNGGRARILGVEVEATARPVEAVTATFGLSRLDTKYLEITPGAVIPANAVLPFTPKWSLSGGLAYEFEKIGRAHV